MNYELCGDCLHSRHCHTQIKDIYHCGACGKLCEKIQYHTDHKPSSIIIQDGRAYQLGVRKK